MASKSAIQSSSTVVHDVDAQDLANSHAAALMTRFMAALLPDEARDFDAGRLAEAALFTATVATLRKGSEPAIAIESVSGSTTGTRHLRIAVINDDMPFLVDSIA